MLPSQPLWRKIANALEDKIKSRELNPGDKLPTENRMSREFMANRHTVRRALAHLQDKGLVESTQGRGSFVRRPALAYLLGRRSRFTDNLIQQRAEPRTETLKLSTQAGDGTTSSALGLKLGALVILLERAGYANDEPIGLTRHYFSFERFPTFIEMYRQRGSITQTLIDSGVPDYTRVRTRVSSRLPTPAEADRLRMPRHVPLIVTQSWNADGLGHPIEYGEARLASDRVELLVEPEQLPSRD